MTKIFTINRLLVVALTLLVAPLAARKPNVIIISTDDQGSIDKTPLLLLEWAQQARLVAEWQRLVVSEEKTELFDLPHDLGEAVNLATKNPEVVAKLVKASQRYWASIRAKK